MIYNKLYKKDGKDMSLASYFEDRKLRKAINEAIEYGKDVGMGRCEYCGNEDYLVDVKGAKLCEKCCEDLKENIVENYDIVLNGDSLDEMTDGVIHIDEACKLMITKFDQLEQDAQKQGKSLKEFVKDKYGMSLNFDKVHSSADTVNIVDTYLKNKANSPKYHLNRFIDDYECDYVTDNALNSLVPDADGYTAKHRVRGIKKRNRKSKNSMGISSNTANASNTTVKPLSNNPATVVKGSNTAVSTTNNTNSVTNISPVSQVASTVKTAMSSVSNTAIDLQRLYKKAPMVYDFKGFKTTLGTVVLNVTDNNDKDIVYDLYVGNDIVFKGLVTPVSDIMWRTEEGVKAKVWSLLTEKMFGSEAKTKQGINKTYEIKLDGNKILHNMAISNLNGNVLITVKGLGENEFYDSGKFGFTITDIDLSKWTFLTALYLKEKADKCKNDVEKAIKEYAEENMAIRTDNMLDVDKNLQKFERELSEVIERIVFDYYDSGADPDYSLPIRYYLKDGNEKLRKKYVDKLGSKAGRELIKSYIAKNITKALEVDCREAMKYIDFDMDVELSENGEFGTPFAFIFSYDESDAEELEKIAKKKGKETIGGYINDIMIKDVLFENNRIDMDSVENGNKVIVKIDTIDIMNNGDLKSVMFECR